MKMKTMNDPIASPRSQRKEGTGEKRKRYPLIGNLCETKYFKPFPNKKCMPDQTTNSAMILFDNSKYFKILFDNLKYYFTLIVMIWQ